MTTDDYAPTGDHFEIDVSEVQSPSYDHLDLQQYPAKGNTKIAQTGTGWGANLDQNLAAGFHDFGVLWTPSEIIYEIDGQPIAAAVTNGAVHPPTNVASRRRWCMRAFRLIQRDTIFRFVHSASFRMQSDVSSTGFATK
jgi:hypothetical protein